MANKTFKDLANRLDRTSAFFLVGTAMLEPYIDMGQPRVSPEDGETNASLPRSAADFDSAASPALSTDYAVLPPHEQYGNIYFPYHIEQTESIGFHLRFQVVAASGEIAVPSACWAEAMEVARWLNAGSRPPAVDIIVARSRRRICR